MTPGNKRDTINEASPTKNDTSGKKFDMSSLMGRLDKFKASSEKASKKRNFDNYS